MDDLKDSVFFVFLNRFTGSENSIFFKLVKLLFYNKLSIKLILPSPSNSSYSLSLA